MKAICHQLFACFIILFVIAPNVFAQKQGQELIDSLLSELPKAKEDSNKVNMLNALGNAEINVIQYDKALTYLQEALSLSKKLNLKKQESLAYNLIGVLYNSEGNNDEALKNYSEALKIREATNDKRGMAGTYNNIGIIYAGQGRTPEALKMYFAAVKLNEEIDNKPWLANNYNNLSLIYSGQGNYSEALKMAFNALKIFESLGQKERVISTYNNIGILYWSQKEYKDGLSIYQKVIKMNEEVGDLDMNHPYNNMGGIYADMGNYSEALKSYAVSLEIRQKMGNKDLIADSYVGIGIVHQRMNNYTEAINKFDSALNLYRETGNKDGAARVLAALGEVNTSLKNFKKANDLFDSAVVLFKQFGSQKIPEFIYEQRAKLDSAKGDYKGALDNYKLFVLSRDSSVNQENLKKLVSAQMQYDFDKKEATTKAEQDKKDALTKEQLIRQRNVRNFSLAGAAGLLLFLTVVIRQRNRVKKEKKRSDNLLLNILPAETAEELKATGTAAAKDFDEVTVLFTDFKDFTQVSERMNAHELVNEIHYFFSEFDKIVSKHNIEKIKTIGDSYMAAGGLPTPNKTNAVDTVSAALEIQSFMKNINEQRRKEKKPFFGIRIGVNTGPVVAGIVGIKKFAYDIWGDTVNIASRMESSGEEGKVNISDTTYELVKDKFNCTYRGKINAKHKGEIDMYFVENIS